MIHNTSENIFCSKICLFRTPNPRVRLSGCTFPLLLRDSYGREVRGSYRSSGCSLTLVYLEIYFDVRFGALTVKVPQKRDGALFLFVGSMCRRICPSEGETSADGTFVLPLDRRHCTFNLRCCFGRQPTSCYGRTIYFPPLTAARFPCARRRPFYLFPIMYLH